MIANPRDIIYQFRSISNLLNSRERYVSRPEFFSVRLHATLHAIYSITDMRFVSSVDLVNQSRELPNQLSFNQLRKEPVSQ